MPQFGVREVHREAAAQREALGLGPGVPRAGPGVSITIWIIKRKREMENVMESEIMLRFRVGGREGLGGLVSA